MKPQRIQRQRTKGWRMPENTVYVGRASKWGNPYRVGALFFDKFRETDHTITAERAVYLFRKYTTLTSIDFEELRGKNLACWCRLDAPCHADVLLDWANA
jgi:hypothetical protein